jgi:putative ABC transport system permease protein
MMFRTYFKIAFRSLLKHKTQSFINIVGLSAGMAVSVLIGLWLYDELGFNKYHNKYSSVAKVMFSCNYNGDRIALSYNSHLMGQELTTSYKSDFNKVVMSTFNADYVLTQGERMFSKKGNFMEPDAVSLLGLRMINSNGAALNDPNSILLNESLAVAFFGKADPIGQVIRIDNSQSVKVTGIYEDLPYNSEFKDLAFIAPWKLFLIMNPAIEQNPRPWSVNRFQTFVEMTNPDELESVSAKLKNLLTAKLPAEDASTLKPEVFLYPMARWHLYSPTNDGSNTHDRIEYVWMVAVIGLAVLALACINFVNISTAQSESRAKEVGVRKTLGSDRKQLIYQFFAESMIAVGLAFILCILWSFLLLPSFNILADKQMRILWFNPYFWILSILFTLLTGLTSGLYPALYLSSFKPVEVLKNTFRLGKSTSLPRKVLVVVQLTVSVSLIAVTLLISNQIQYAQKRPLGYNFNNLITIPITPDIARNFSVIRNELIGKRIADEAGASVNTTTEFNTGDINFDWTGKDSKSSVGFAVSNVTYEYGKTIGWQLTQGRDFSRNFSTDSTGVVINQAAAKLIGFKQPLGQTIKWNNKPYHIIGVIKDILFESPYQAVTPSVFHMSSGTNRTLTIRLNSRIATIDAIGLVRKVLSVYNPNYPFEYQFVDLSYANKFKDELAIEKLTTFFAILALFISCLGLFAMTSFMAVKRGKEISIRKVLGASVFSLWNLLVKDILLMVLISILISTPIAFVFMFKWLQSYQYRTPISFLLFVVADCSALLVAILTVSYQVLKTAMRNPTATLKS